jgi:serine/threonine-protein kinase
MKALSKNPANRYQTARAFMEDLERVRNGRDVDATPLMAAANGAEATQVIARPQSTQVLPPQTDEPGSGRKVWLGVLIGILIVALLAGGGWLLAQALGGDDVQTITLDNYRGQEFSVVKADLELLGLQVERKDSPRDPDEFPSETVIRTTPGAGSVVNEGDPIEVLVAVAPDLVEVPSVVELTPAAAVSLLEQFNLVLGDETPAPSEDIPVGQIISQSPEAGDEAEPGSAVDVVVSTGIEEIEVPSVTCQKVEGALSELRAAGLDGEVVGTVTPLTNCQDPANIAMQDPEPGTPVEPGTVVQLWQGEAPTSESPPPEGE